MSRFLGVRWFMSCAGVAAAISAALISAGAAEPKVPPAAKTVSPEIEIRATAAAFVQAFNRGDAQAVAALWTPEGTAAEADGTIFKGRPAIADEYAKLFQEHPQAKIVVAVQSVDFPTPSTAIEDGISQVRDADGSPPQVSRYTAVHVKLDGKWLVASVRESDVELPSNFAKVESLGWLVGTWTAERDNTKLRTTVRWIANNSFLERDYAISTDGIVTSSGKQIIGYDPKSEKIRSWSFDASGGHGTGVWTETPQGWQIEQSGVMPDGTPTSSRDTLIRIPGEDNVLGWKSVARKVGDTDLADMPEVVLDRAAAKNAKSK